MGRTIAELSKETLDIQLFLEKQLPGTELSYLEIEEETSVKMDLKGKSHLRTALHRAKIEYSPIQGYGIKLADTQSVTKILANKLTKVDRSVKRADKTHKNLETQFFTSLPAAEQKQVLFLGAVFGAIRLAAENGKIAYGRSTPKVIDKLSIPLPEK